MFGLKSGAASAPSAVTASQNPTPQPAMPGGGQRAGLAGAAESGVSGSAQRIQQAVELLQGPLGQQLDDPAFRQAAATYDRFLNDGEQPEGITKESLYDFGTRLFAREMQKGVGDKLPDGSTITEKRLVSAYQRGDEVALELDIRAQKPDGTPFNYRAPVTKGRTSKDTDEVLFIPLDAIRDRIRGARYLSQAVEQAGGVANVLAQLQQPSGGA
ncbi:MAG: hypothetical protein EPN60_05315 [Nevskiaceae bacterium]|nr:MAG: hypothetical protein EPN60_05315 [Nevskiaceae bacterium]